MKHYFYLSLVLVLGAITIASAQQASQYSLYMLNPYDLNPAYAGMDETLKVNGVFRKQWTGLEGSPTDQSVNVHLPVFYLNGGFGAKFENDVIGAEQSLKAVLTFAYQYELGDLGKISLGASGGVLQKSLDGSMLRAPEGVYEGGTFTHNDPQLPEVLVKSMVPVFDIGLYYKGENLEIGLSANNVLEPNIILEEVNETNLLLKRNYFLTFVYSLDMSENVRLMPSVLLKTDANQIQGEASLLVRYRDNVLGGVSWRGYNANTTDALSLIVGFKVSSKLWLNYAYDVGLSQLNSVHQGSHEILLQYDLNRLIGKGKLEKIIYNPRFL